MATFDLDDPLGDLLSDGSNDSFFEEPKVLAKRASLTKTPEKKAVSDLFGLDEAPKKDVKNKSDDWLGLSDDLGAKPEKPTAKAMGKSAKKISFDDEDDDIFSSLGIEKKGSRKGSTEDTRLNKGDGKKTSLLDSIMGSTKEKATTSLDDILKESKALKVDTSGPKTDMSTFKPETPKLDQQKFGLSSLEGPREGRRGRSLATNLMDPLGLLSNESRPKTEPDLKKTEAVPASPARKRDPSISKPVSWLGTDTVKELEVNRGDSDIGVKTEVLYNAPKQDDLKTKSAPNLTNLPDWLGGSNQAMKAHKSDIAINNVGIDDKNVASEKIVPTVSEQSIDSQLKVDSMNAPMLQSLLTQQKLATSHIEYQNTALAMQQQESQLMVALQLKKYEENLAEMQKQQQDILIKQEQQFNTLLERQFSKQQIMENNMRLQQERINNHIQLLMTQPPVSGSLQSEETSKIDELKKTNAEEITNLYEQIIASLKQHQHEEIFLLEESYKKQISTLESTSEQVENRLKAEIEKLLEKHQSQLVEVQKEHDEEVKKYKEKLDELMEGHKNEIRKIRENQNALIDEIKYEYSNMVATIKETKTTESNMFENVGTYAQKLDASMKMLDVNSKALLDIREKVEQDYSVLKGAQQESIKAKEEELKMMRIALERAREVAETERSQLMGLVRSLEMKLAEQQQAGREERWALQQATATLTARAAALDREAEFSRASLEQERAQIKTMKENLLAEQERILLHLTEEKLALSAERSRLETQTKLRNNYDNQKAHAEVEAAIQAAKEATEQTFKEREAVHRQKLEIENYKRQLEERERTLYAKEQNLESISKNAERKASEGERAFMEAKNMENMYNRQLKGIQQQLSSLALREKKLAEEKIALSKERLALNSANRLAKKCSLCNIETVSRLDEEINEQEVEQDMPQYYAVTDPELLRLRFEIENDNQNYTPKS